MAIDIEDLEAIGHIFYQFRMEACYFNKPYGFLGIEINRTVTGCE
jgi:hypothetical protein